MRIYEPLNSVGGSIHYLSSASETDIQFELAAKLRKDKFRVQSSVGIGQKHLKGVVFDLVIFENKTAIAIVEVKSPMKGPREDLNATTQGLKYRSFGIPVILFWDLSFYEDLKDFLRSKKVKNAILKTQSSSHETMEYLYKTLNVASMKAFDLRNVSPEFQQLESSLEEKRDRVKEIMDGLK